MEKTHPEKIMNYSVIIIIAYISNAMSTPHDCCLLIQQCMQTTWSIKFRGMGILIDIQLPSMITRSKSLKGLLPLNLVVYSNIYRRGKASM